MDEKQTRKPRGKVPLKDRLEMLDPEYRTGFLDGYARAIQSMNQSKRDEILRRIATR